MSSNPLQIYDYTGICYEFDIIDFTMDIFSKQLIFLQPP